MMILRAEKAKMSNVQTWADGFGVWHARVGDLGLGFAEAHRIAHKAIGTELQERGDQPQSVEVVFDHLDRSTGYRSYEFKEA